MRELWQCCFGDEQDYLDLCFHQGNAVSHGAVLEAAGTVQSMLLVFSQGMTLPDGETVPMWYVYAFCTAPEWQSRGYGRTLLAWTETAAAQADVKAVVMVPGEPSLFQFYECLGYETACFTRETMVTQRKNTPLHLKAERCDLKIYQTLRERFLRGSSYVFYPEESLTWQKTLCDASGGGLFQIEDGIAAVERWGGNVVVKELLSHQMEEAAQAILQTCGVQQALIRGVPSGPAKPFGVVRWLTQDVQRRWNQGQGRYLGLAFD